MDRITLQKEQAKPTLPPMLPAASVMATPQNLPWANHSTPSLSDRTPSYGAFGFQRADYDLRQRHNRFISFAVSDFEMVRTALLEKYKYSSHTRLYPERQNG